MAWTSPRTFVTGEIVTAAIMNAHVRDNMLALEARGDASQSDVTGSRAIDGTVYQNSGTGIRIVTVNVIMTKTNAAEYSRVTFHCDAATPPTTQIGRLALQPDGSALGGDLITEMAFTFVVLPSYYYKATESHTGTISTLADWFEWALNTGL